MIEHWEIYVDGAASPNSPGKPAAAAYWVRVNLVTRAEGGLYLSGTVNYAELVAVILGLRYFVEHAPETAKLTLYSDSLWTVQRIAFKLNLDISNPAETQSHPDLFQEIAQFWDPNRMSIKYIPREFNEKADSLAGIIKKRGY